MNCSTFKRSIESRDEIKGDMLTHFETCGECRRFADEEKKLDGILAQLPKAPAPDGFGVSVRSRIAGGRSPVSGLWSSARIAIPAAAMVFIVGFVVVNSDLFVSTRNDNEAIAVKLENDPGNTARDSGAKPGDGGAEAPEDQTVGTGEPDEIQDVSNRAKDPSVGKSGPEIAAVDSKPETRGPAPGGGTKDFKDLAFEEPETSNPPGLNPDKEVKIKPDGPKKAFSTREILDFLGVKSVWKGGRLFVVSVAENSIGARSGIREGDEIHSLDGKQVRQSTFALGRANGEVLGVIRGGRRLSIKIGTQQ